MVYTFFDTETTGTPKNYKAPMTELDNWPRVIQLAWVRFTDEGVELDSAVDLIKPDGWVVPVADFWTKHGYSTEKNMENGVPALSALGRFAGSLRESDAVIAHNMNFDYNIIGAEMIRYEVAVGKKVPRLCTMQASTGYCKIPQKNGWGGFKWPKLEELHQKLFSEGFDGAHDAMCDVRAGMRCFLELKRLGIM